MSHRYIKHTWQVGEVVTQTQMNAIETGIDRAVDLSGDTMTGQLIIKNALPSLQLMSPSDETIRTRFENSITTSEQNQLSHHCYIAQHIPSSEDTLAYELFHLPKTYEGASRTNYNIFTSKNAHEGAAYYSYYPAGSTDHDLTYGTLPVKYGGTGITTLGTPGQVLSVNAAGTGTTWLDMEGGGGAQLDLSRLTTRIGRISGPIYYDSADIVQMSAQAIQSTGVTTSATKNRTTGFIRVLKGDFIQYGGVTSPNNLSVAFYEENTESSYTGEFYQYWSTTDSASVQHIIPISRNGYVKCSWLLETSDPGQPDYQDYSSYLFLALHRTSISRAIDAYRKTSTSLPIPQNSYISIIGDSISTYKGYSAENDSSAYYPINTVTSPNATWWMRVINATNGQLVRNFSIGNSGVTKYNENIYSMYERIHNLGNTNVVYLAAGSVDSQQGVALGEYNFNEVPVNTLSQTTFRTAYIRTIRGLKVLYPDITIICVIFKMEPEYALSIKTIAQHYGVKWVEINDYDLDTNSTLNPNSTGMAKIASAVLWNPDKSLTVSKIPADAAATGDRINNLAGDIYYTPDDIRGLDKYYIRLQAAPLDVRVPILVPSADGNGRITDLIPVYANDLIIYRGLNIQGSLSVVMYDTTTNHNPTQMFYRWWPSTANIGDYHTIQVIKDCYIRAGWALTNGAASNPVDFSATNGLMILRGAAKSVFSYQHNLFTSRYANKNVSIIGDSISTYRGLSNINSGDPAARYPLNNVLDPNQTWWMKVINASGGTLKENLSYSGSYVISSSTRPSFYDRAQAGLLNNPDLIFVALGTNDSLNNVPLGNYDYMTYIDNLPTNQFRPAYIKGVRALMANYPNAEIICVSLAMEDDYIESICNIAHHYGLKFIDASNYDGVVEGNVHPDVIGMNQIASTILYSTDSSLVESNVPADAAAVGAAIQALSARVSALENA